MSRKHLVALYLGLAAASLSFDAFRAHELACRESPAFPSLNLRANPSVGLIRVLIAPAAHIPFTSPQRVPALRFCAQLSPYHVSAGLSGSGARNPFDSRCSCLPISSTTALTLPLPPPVPTPPNPQMKFASALLLLATKVAADDAGTVIVSAPADRLLIRDEHDDLTR